MYLTRNIGIPVKKSTKSPINGEKNNPFNGTLSIRGKLFEGIVVNNDISLAISFDVQKAISNLKDLCNWSRTLLAWPL